MERKAVDLGGGYRLAVRDEWNWKLQKLREPSARNGRAKSFEPRWCDTGNFFQSLGHALAFVFERRMREEGEQDESLANLARRCEEIRDELLRVS